MPKAYLHVELEVTDRAVFETYRTGQRERADIAEYGGRYLVLLEATRNCWRVIASRSES